MPTGVLMTEHTQRCDPISDAVLKIFKRIGEQFEFKEIWNTLPNAERSYLAGDFYNIIQSTSATPAPAACEDNGCTDTDACDEICDNQRIYSPAWVKRHDAVVRKEALTPIVAYLNKHLEEENTKIRLSNEVGNADAGNRAGDIWAAYYGTLIQIPESLRKEVSCEQDGG